MIVGRVSQRPIDIEVTSDDKLILLKTVNNGHFRTKAYEHVNKISCTLPEILHKVQEGQLLRDLMTHYGFSE
jgi:hypothetical protein